MNSRMSRQSFPVTDRQKMRNQECCCVSHCATDRQMMRKGSSALVDYEYGGKLIIIGILDEPGSKPNVMRCA